MKPHELKGDKIGVTAFIEDVGEGPSFEGIPFRVEAGEKPPLDGFAVVERDDGDSLHYGRIASGHEENPETDPRRQQQNEAYSIGDTDDLRAGDLSPQVTRIMVLDPLGEVVSDDDGSAKLRQPTDLPQTGQDVYEVSASKIHSLLGLPGPDEDEGFHIGHIESGGETAPFKLSREVPARHIAILGRTGVGKTHTAHVTIEELVEQGVPVVSFDVLDDAINMAEDLGGTTLQPDSDLQIPYSLLGFSEFEGFLSNLTDTQKELVQTVYAEIHEDALDQLREEGTVDIGFDRLLDDIETYGNRINSRATDAAVNRTRWALINSGLLNSGMDDWAELMAENPMLNIDIGHLGQRDRTLIIGATARMLQQLRRRGEVPPFVLVIDEAHKHIPSGRSETPSSRVVRDLVQTARHIGIGTVLITQSPSSLDQVTLRTCNTHVVLSLDSEELSSVKGLFGDLSRSSIDRIPKLKKGRAMIASARDLIQHTVPVDIRDRETREGAPTPDLVDDAREWFEQYDPGDEGLQGGLDEFGDDDSDDATGDGDFKTDGGETETEEDQTGLGDFTSDDD